MKSHKLEDAQARYAITFETGASLPYRWRMVGCRVLSTDKDRRLKSSYEKHAKGQSKGSQWRWWRGEGVGGEARTQARNVISVGARVEGRWALSVLSHASLQAVGDGVGSKWEETQTPLPGHC